MPEIQDMTYKMQPQWLECLQNSDCGLITYDCAHLAVTVNRSYTSDAKEVICKTELCSWTTCAPNAYNFLPACEEGRCVTRLRPSENN